MTNELPDAMEGVRYDQETDTYRTTFDNTTSKPSIAVVSALANVLNQDPTNLPPLYEDLNPDALDRFLATSNGDTISDRKIVFTFQNYTVSILSYGLIEIQAIPDNATAEEV